MFGNEEKRRSLLRAHSASSVSKGSVAMCAETRCWLMLVEKFC